MTKKMLYLLSIIIIMHAREPQGSFTLTDQFNAAEKQFRDNPTLENALAVTQIVDDVLSSVRITPGQKDFVRRKWQTTQQQNSLAQKAEQTWEQYKESGDPAILKVHKDIDLLKKKHTALLIAESKIKESTLSRKFYEELLRELDDIITEIDRLGSEGKIELAQQAISDVEQAEKKIEAAQEAAATGDTKTVEKELQAAEQIIETAKEKREEPYKRLSVADLTKRYQKLIDEHQALQQKVNKTPTSASRTKRQEYLEDLDELIKNIDSIIKSGDTSTAAILISAAEQAETNIDESQETESTNQPSSIQLLIKAAENIERIKTMLRQKMPALPFIHQKPEPRPEIRPQPTPETIEPEEPKKLPAPEKSEKTFENLFDFNLQQGAEKLKELIAEFPAEYINRGMPVVVNGKLKPSTATVLKMAIIKSAGLPLDKQIEIINTALQKGAHIYGALPTERWWVQTPLFKLGKRAAFEPVPHHEEYEGSPLEIAMREKNAGATALLTLAGHQINKKTHDLAQHYGMNEVVTKAAEARKEIQETHESKLSAQKKQERVEGIFASLIRYLNEFIIWFAGGEKEIVKMAIATIVDEIKQEVNKQITVEKEALGHVKKIIEEQMQKINDLADKTFKADIDALEKTKQELIDAGARFATVAGQNLEQAKTAVINTVKSAQENVAEIMKKDLSQEEQSTLQKALKTFENLTVEFSATPNNETLDKYKILLKNNVWQPVETKINRERDDAKKIAQVLADQEKNIIEPLEKSTQATKDKADKLSTLADKIVKLHDTDQEFQESQQALGELKKDMRDIQTAVTQKISDKITQGFDAAKAVTEDFKHLASDISKHVIEDATNAVVQAAQDADKKLSPFADVLSKSLADLRKDFDVVGNDFIEIAQQEKKVKDLSLAEFDKLAKTLQAQQSTTAESQYDQEVQDYLKSEYAAEMKYGPVELAPERRP